MIFAAIFVITFSMAPTQKLGNFETQATQKPVILIAIDSLMDEPLQKAMKEGKAPAIAYLIEKGNYIPDMISSYPTMSVSIDSTILTGVYANEHKIPGLIWFNEKEQRIVSYGSGMREIWDNGVKNVAKDSIIRLNNDNLSKDVTTIYEELSSAQIPSASINGLIFRGDTKHHLNVPNMISWMKLLPKEIEVNGPTLLSLGVLSQYNPDNDQHKFIWSRMGVNDEFTVNEVKYLIDENRLPPFTLAYLPDADAVIHEKGPKNIRSIEKADQAIQELLNQFSTWEEAIEKVAWVIVGDSGQSYVEKEKNAGLINLNDLLKEYSFWSSENPKAELAIGINERMAYIYLNGESIEMTSIINKLKEDERIGFIAWKDSELNYVTSPDEDRLLSFSPNGQYVDSYQQSWSLDGDSALLDISLTENGQIQYNQYPDALAR